MRYLPKSPAERTQMLADIGAASIDDLFSVIPASTASNATSTSLANTRKARLSTISRLPHPQNTTRYTSFLGAGAYRITGP